MRNLCLSRKVAIIKIFASKLCEKMPIESCMWAIGVSLHIAVEVADQTYHHSFAFSAI
jgi:hypothetical protein